MIVRDAWEKQQEYNRLMSQLVENIDRVYPKPSRWVRFKRWMRDRYYRMVTR